MEQYNSKEAYLSDLENRAALPVGFRCAAVTFNFVPAEKQMNAKMNLSLILADKPTEVFGAVYTKNSFPGNPVLIGKERLANKQIQGFLINNKVSNVCTPGGYETACALLDKMGAELGIDSQLLFPFSTGIIGWKLPFADMSSALPSLAAGLHNQSFLPLAQSIMTTDSFAKLRSATAGEGRIVGIAKGAGMIEPNMATMLCFLLTDIAITREELRQALAACTAQTFNAISIDSDQSTSDSAIIMSSCVKPSPGLKVFTEALQTVCAQLAEDVVRNGEGTGHVMRVTVEGDIPETVAAALGKAVVNSPLCKTAVFGNDPNVGRIIAAIGDYLGTNAIPVDQSKLTLTMGGIEIFKNKQFLLDTGKEQQLSAYLNDCKLDTAVKGYPQHNKVVEIGISLGGKAMRRSVLGSDLSYEYVKENADYRS